MEAAFQVKSTGPWGRESQGRGVRAGTVARGRGVQGRELQAGNPRDSGGGVALSLLADALP